VISDDARGVKLGPRDADRMWMSAKLWIVAIGLSLGSCAHQGAGREPQGESALNQAWSEAVLQTKNLELQSPCKPRSVVPPRGVAVRGKVILIHGFTACPQQYFEWSERLAEAGWISYMLLLPGHGRKPLADGSDDFSAFPGAGQDEAYENVAKAAVAIARADSLPTVVVGLSVGGAIALDAVLRSPEDFERALLVSPFFAASNTLLRSVGLPLVGHVPFLRKKRIGWGPSCVDELKRGRGGVCNFRFDQLDTAQSYGKRVVRHTRPVTTQVQIIGIQNDGAASNEWILKAAKKLGWNKNPRQIEGCFYQEGANHSLFSRFDSPDQNKFWLESLLNSATEFVDESKPFSALDQDVKSFGVCQIQSRK